MTHGQEDDLTRDRFRVVQTSYERVDGEGREGERKKLVIKKVSGQAVQRCSKWQCEKLLVCDTTRVYRDRAGILDRLLKRTYTISRWDIRRKRV